MKLLSTPVLPPAVDVALPLLGGLTPQQFMRRHWHKKPLLVRQAIPGFVPPLERKALFDLAGREGVESRLIAHGAQGWALKHGPFVRRSLPPTSRPQPEVTANRGLRAAQAFRRRLPQAQPSTA